MATKDKELATVSTTEVRTLAPVSVQKRGMEHANFDKSDFVIPRAKIVQALSKEATDGDVRPGSVVNTATGEVLAGPEEVFQVQIVVVSVGQALFDKGRSLLCYSVDGITGEGDPGGDCRTCPLAQWGTDEEGKTAPPACMKTYNFLSRFIGTESEDIPINLSMSKTSAKTAKKINTRLRFLTGDIWEIGLKLKTTKRTNEKGVFHVLELVGSERTTDEQKDSAEALYNFLQNTAYTLAQDIEPDETSDDDGERPSF